MQVFRLVIVSALSVVASAAINAQQPVTKTVIMSDAPTYRASDSTWQFRYAVATPLTPRQGPFGNWVMSIRGPEALGATVDVADSSLAFLGGGAINKVFDGEPYGVARLTLHAPSRTRWGASLDPNGDLNFYARGSGKAPSSLGPNQRMTFVMESRGMPMLRESALLPALPPSRISSTTGDVIPVSRAAYARMGIVPDTVRAVVAGPGVPAAYITSTVVREQIDLACSKQLLPAAACSALVAAVESRMSNARASFAVALSLLTSRADLHPLLRVTVVPQLQLLATGRIPAEAWSAMQ